MLEAFHMVRVTDKTFEIYHILQVYQSGEKINIDFSRDNYLGKYKDFLNLINEWIER